MSESDDLFAHARAHEGELTGRQREVLEMVAAGRTNAEIADALGISFAGAKWHVAEVYSKLGLASREEAAAYWHKRHGRGRVVAFMRGIASAMSWKVASGSLALAGVVATIAVLFVVFSRDETTPAAAGFRKPYTITLEHRENGRLVSTTEHLVGSEENQRVTHLIQDGANVMTAVSDGEELFVVTAAEPLKYTVRPFSPSPDHVAVSTPLFWAGGFTGTAVAGSAEKTAEYLRERNADPGSMAQVVGREQVIGRETAVIEGSPLPGADGAGSYRAWVDLETMVILRWQTHSPANQSLEVVATAFDPASNFPSDTFVFVPPPGAVREEVTPDPNRPDAAGVRTPPGYLAVTELPGKLSPFDINGPNPIGEIHMWFGVAGAGDINKNSPFLLFDQFAIDQSNRPVIQPWMRKVSPKFGGEAWVETLDTGATRMFIDFPASRATIETDALTEAELLAWVDTLELR